MLLEWCVSFKPSPKEWGYFSHWVLFWGWEGGHTLQCERNTGCLLKHPTGGRDEICNPGIAFDLDSNPRPSPVQSRALTIEPPRRGYSGELEESGDQGTFKQGFARSPSLSLPCLPDVFYSGVKAELHSIFKKLQLFMWQIQRIPFKEKEYSNSCNKTLPNWPYIMLQIRMIRNSVLFFL